MRLSLRPYSGALYYAKSKKEYERLHKEVFGGPDILTCAHEGRFAGGQGKDGMWTYLVYAKNTPALAHEFMHVAFHVFERCGMNPSDSGGEAFCYLVQQMMNDAKN